MTSKTQINRKCIEYIMQMKKVQDGWHWQCLQPASSNSWPSLCRWLCTDGTYPDRRPAALQPVPEMPLHALAWRSAWVSGRRKTEVMLRNGTDCAVENEGSHVIGEFVDGRGVRVQFWNCRSESNCHMAKRWGCCEVEPPSELLFYAPELRLANLRTGWLLHVGTEFSMLSDPECSQPSYILAACYHGRWLCTAHRHNHLPRARSRSRKPLRLAYEWLTTAG